MFKHVDEMSRESTKQLLQEAYIIRHHSHSKYKNLIFQKIRSKNRFVGRTFSFFFDRE